MVASIDVELVPGTMAPLLVKNLMWFARCSSVPYTGQTIIDHEGCGGSQRRDETRGEGK